MPYKNLAQFIATLEKKGELIRIKKFVSPRLEISEVTDRIVKNNGKALLFENNGTGFPLLINAFASEKRMSLALGVKKLDDIGEEVGGVIRELISPKDSLMDKLKVIGTLREVASWLPKVISGRGPCQEVVMKEPDLSLLPVLTCWPADGGPFITLPMVHTHDATDGTRNLGMYRMQVFSKDMTGMHWHLHKGSAHHFLKYRELNKRMPVTVTLGGDPAYTYVATAPLPDNFDEYILAGFIRRKRVELVKCLTNELEIPADVDFVIEGYVDPGEDLILEGPFGDHTGFYSLAGYFPRFHVTCITHRKNAVYPATIVGIPPMEDAFMGMATERIFLAPIRMVVMQELTDMAMPVEGVFHNLAFVSIEKSFPGQGVKTMNSLWGAGQMMFNKIMVVVDKDVNIHNFREVATLVSGIVNPLEDIHFIRGPVDILDHSSRSYAFGSKLGIDATRKLPGENQTGHDTSAKAFIDKEGLLKAFPEIGEINDTFPAEGILAVVISVKKSRKGQLRDISRNAIRTGLISGVKFILFLDAGVDIFSDHNITWISTNNIDPGRDCFFVDQSEDEKYPGLFIDGTRKSGNFDHFERDWPNIIVMDDETITSIDNKWKDLGLGSMIPSPSLKYKKLVKSIGAVS
jgi:4-hydroxy-3-polyprenylbenzoate decarboxylase